MRIKSNKLKEGRLLKEGIFDKFVDSLVDAYKKGIEDQFIEKSKKADPVLASKAQRVIDNLDELDRFLKKLK